LRLWKGEGLWKEGRIKEEEIKDFKRGKFGGLFFFIIQNLHNMELKNCTRRGFWKAYINSSNSTYVCIIFIKKIY